MDLVLELLNKIGWINVVEITVIILLEVFYFYFCLSVLPYWRELQLALTQITKFWVVHTRGLLEKY